MVVDGGLVGLVSEAVREMCAVKLIGLGRM